MRTWTTADLPQPEQFSYWREVICEAFTRLDPAAAARGSFESAVIQRHIADIAINDTRSKAQFITRGPREIRLNPTPRFFINLQLSGTCRFRQDSREAMMRPGDFYLVDTTRPYEQDYEDFRVLCVSIPHHVLAPRLLAAERSTAVPLSCDDGGLGTIAGSFIKSLHNCADATDPVVKERLATSLVDVLALALGGTIDAKERAGPAVSQGLCEAIRSHIRRNAADPELSVASVAATFRISPRYVHKLLERSDASFAQLVLEERLQRCAADLGFPGSGRSISEIAYRSGFGDLSHFCRAFRKRFGMSARSFRVKAETTTIPPVKQ